MGYRVIRAGTITGASIQVDALDATRSFTLSVRLNGAEVQTLTLPVSTLGVDGTFGVPTAVVAGDIITVFMVRASGGGASTFDEESAAVEVTL